MQAGVVSGPIDRSSAPKPATGITPVHDLNVPYEGTEEYETPTAEILFPPVSVYFPVDFFLYSFGCYFTSFACIYYLGFVFLDFFVVHLCLKILCVNCELLN